MSKFTTEVRFIVETAAGLEESTGFDNVDEIVEIACPIVFNFDFPLFDETYRLVLEKKILMHYYTREIGEETVGLWKLRLCNRLREIMPYYNKLYESELLTFNPLYDVDLRTDYRKTTDGQTTGTEINQDSRETNAEGRSGSTDNTVDATHRTRADDANSSSTSWNLYSDTPQGGIEGIESDTTGSQTVNNLYYLTNATKQTYQGQSEDDITEDTTSNRSNAKNVESESVNKSTGESKAATNTSVSNIDDYADHVIGKRGSRTYASMLKEFRETFLNIDMMIINDLKDLFFGLWA